MTHPRGLLPPEQVGDRTLSEIPLGARPGGRGSCWRPGESHMWWMFQVWGAQASPGVQTTYRSQGSRQDWGGSAVDRPLGVRWTYAECPKCQPPYLPHDGACHYPRFFEARRGTGLRLQNQAGYRSCLRRGQALRSRGDFSMAAWGRVSILLHPQRHC